MTLKFYIAGSEHLRVEILGFNVTRDTLSYAPISAEYVICKVILRPDTNMWETEHDGLFESFSVVV